MGYIVITTIQVPTSSVHAMVKMGLRHGLNTLLVGDRKTPGATDWPEEVDFLSLAEQRNLGFKLAALLPENHYARKNVGYLYALSRRASVIFDTDDDNAPLASWYRRSIDTVAQPCLRTGWINAYQYFTTHHIWPRGFPLEQIGSVQKRRSQLDVPLTIKAPIQQGLASGSPDVDAVWRLTQDQEILFEDANSIYLPNGAWCPFNSQSTWWFPEAYVLMYLPSYVSFRMTDIWRSFIAQRCLWAMGYGMVFHGPEMFQERNPHNLLRDFEQEIQGYLGNSRICELLGDARLSNEKHAMSDNLYLCYEILVRAGYIPAEEMLLLEAWLQDLSATSI